jgi:tetratricopeptide (TPR) repeat protein
VVELALDRWSNTKVARSMAERPTGTQKRWFLGLVAILIVCVVALQFVLNRTAEPASGEEVVSLLLARERPFEGRLSGQPYLPFVRTRDSQTGVAYGVLAGEMTRLGADSYQMGRFYLIHKDFIKAISYLEMAEKEVGARPEFHNDLGAAYLEAGEEGLLGKAGDEFRHALRADPEFVPAAFNLAIFYERTGLLSEARDQLERFLELDPSSEWAGEARAKLEGLSR